MSGSNNRFDEGTWERFEVTLVASSSASSSSASSSSAAEFCERVATMSTEALRRLCYQLRLKRAWRVAARADAQARAADADNGTVAVIFVTGAGRVLELRVPLAATEMIFHWSSHFDTDGLALLTDGITRLTSLSKIRIECAAFKRLPSVLCRLPLRELLVRDASLRTIPPAIALLAPTLAWLRVRQGGGRSIFLIAFAVGLERYSFCAS